MDYCFLKCVIVIVYVFFNFIDIILPSNKAIALFPLFYHLHRGIMPKVEVPFYDDLLACF